MSLTRRAPLQSRTGLHRGKPLARTSPLRTLTGLTSRGTHARPADAMSGRHRGERKPPRDTGPDPKTRLIVLNRDQYRCVRCGKAAGPGGVGPYSLQHRKARGVGGTNDLANLIVLCGSSTSPGGCHALAESRDREAQAQGYWLESWQDPGAEGVMYASEHGSGITLWLAPDGGLLHEPPERAA
jgi:hypothetical protein